MSHSAVGVGQIGRWKFEVVEVEWLFAAHPIDEHRPFVKREIALVARVEFPSESNLILVGASDADAVLLSIYDYLSAIVTRPGVLESETNRNDRIKFQIAPIGSLSLLS